MYGKIQQEYNMRRVASLLTGQLLLMIPFSWLDAQSEHYKKVLQGLSYTTSTRSLLALAWFSGAVMLLSAVVLIRSHYRYEHRQAKDSQKKFKKLCARRGLTDTEIKLLKRIAVLGGIRFIGDLLTRRQVYNSAVGHFIEKVVNPSESLRKELYFKELTSIRRKIGFNQPQPFKPIRTTREVPVNTQVSFQSGKVTYEGTVMDNNEESIIIIPPEGSEFSPQLRGKRIMLTFYRVKDGHYFIPTRIIQVFPEKPMHGIAVSHSSRLKASVKRTTPRVSVNFPCKLSIIENRFMASAGFSGDDGHRGEVLNFSAGGLLLSSVQNIPADSYLQLEFSTGKYQFSGLMARIQRREKEERQFRYHLKYIGVGRLMREQLERAVEHASRHAGQGQ
jgi:hypothetical protein